MRSILGILAVAALVTVASAGTASAAWRWHASPPRWTANDVFGAYTNTQERTITHAPKLSVADVRPFSIPASGQVASTAQIATMKPFAPYISERSTAAGKR